MAERRDSLKTLFLAVPFAISVRDNLRTDVLTTLKESGHRIVILSPTWQDPEFREEFSGPNVFIEPLWQLQPTCRERFFNLVRFLAIAPSSNTQKIKLKKRSRESAAARLLDLAVRVAESLPLTRRRKMVKWADRLEALLAKRHEYDALFARYNPDLVVLTRVFDWSADTVLLKAAHLWKIPTVLCVASWDNLTGKSLIPFRPGGLIVWNEVSKDEAVSLHGYPPERIFVSGIAHFDLYGNGTQFISRQEFLEKLGMNPRKKLLTYTTGSRPAIPHENEIVEMLIDLVNEEAFSRPCQLLVRLHPQAVWEDYAHLQNRGNTVFEVPGKARGFRDRDFSHADLKHLIETMKHSDVVINATSTITLDAFTCDTPVVLVVFDGPRPREFYSSVRRFAHYDHLRKVISRGGVRLAGSVPELIAGVNAYLEDPAREREQRLATVRDFCHRLDGQSGRRIGNRLLDHLNHPPEWHNSETSSPS